VFRTDHDAPVSSDRSVYERVLGADFHLLDPGLRAYFGVIPDGCVGRGTGVYSRAGLRCGILRPLFAILAWRRIAFSEHGRNVPFTVGNRDLLDGSRRALRTFAFDRRERTTRDRMVVEGGVLHDRIGRRGELDTSWRVAAVDGALHLCSTSLAVRVGRLRVPLPRVATVRLVERAGADGTQQVEVRLRMPLLGEVFGYAGSFRYAVEPAAAVSPAGAGEVEGGPPSPR
jgi:hypothetical protein